MKEIDIFGNNRFETYSKTRIGCRGIIIESGKLLVSREEVSDYWMLPGGGLENGETLSDCCVREVLEETGYAVETTSEFLIINEYYGEYKYISHYFLCKVIGQGEQKLTETKKERGLVPKWLDIKDFLDIVSKHQEYAHSHEEKRGAYLREFTAITHYLTMNYQIIKLATCPQLKDTMATWFHQKWGISKEAYMSSMDESLLQKDAVPAWCVAMQDDHIVGGVGVIENDFHDRTDLTPNVCALYVEPEMRGRGIAGALLSFICEDMKRAGYERLYLVTDHISFYERYGWEFLCMVQSEGEDHKSRMYVRIL
jgi:ADP-ribose pyrophosphatase YjhB (NUDIX family)/GNAT superfamily N-acetyltransferase